MFCVGVIHRSCVGLMLLYWVLIGAKTCEIIGAGILVELLWENIFVELGAFIPAVFTNQYFVFAQYTNIFN